MTRISGKAPCAQGELLFIPVDTIPGGLQKVEPQNDVFILGHSETGHHHVLDAPRAEVYEAADDEFTVWVRSLGSGSELRHLRSFDAHETLHLPKGNYMVRRQREYFPGGSQRALD